MPTRPHRARARRTGRACALLAGSAFAALTSFAVQEPEGPRGPAVEVSTACALCHSNSDAATAMRDADGVGVAPFDLWSGTMMANSARDPLWRAVVSAEVAATPSRRADIEAKCLRCHSPMARFAGLDELELESPIHVLHHDSRVGELARDGVSCTICHGIVPDGLGTEASYTAGFRLDDRQRLFGPHAEPFAMPMQRHTGFTPTEASHVTTSALCASCHTLETHALDADGEEVGVHFLEQSPYLEWRNSDFRDEGDPGPLAASCQSCHVPKHDLLGRPISTRIARNPAGRDFPPVEPRDTYGRHAFVGGNTTVLSMLRDFGAELGVTAPAEAFQRTIDAARAQLATATADVSIEDVRAEDGALRFRVAVANRTGHKFPTGHPIRRAWLRVVVRDANGATLFVSGDTDHRGRIVGRDGAPLLSELAGGPIEPHRDVVRAPDEVVLYHAVMSDSLGNATHTLLRGAGWVRDDRLLPKGWRADAPDASRTAPVGVEGDADFVAGGDSVRFELEGLERAASIEVALVYQPVSLRWVAELQRFATPEIARFQRLFEHSDPSPELVARAVWQR
ncbi:MAG: hypothetical protein R3F34_15700 [Planctomycetota bacterium]